MIIGQWFRVTTTPGCASEHWHGGMVVFTTNTARANSERLTSVSIMFPLLELYKIWYVGLVRYPSI